MVVTRHSTDESDRRCSLAPMVHCAVCSTQRSHARAHGVLNADHTRWCSVRRSKLSFESCRATLLFLDPVVSLLVVTARVFLWYNPFSSRMALSGDMCHKE